MDMFDAPWSARRIMIPLRDEWITAAREVISKPGNVCVVGDTGTGKTPTAFLVSMAKTRRTLFLTPTKVLALQQSRSYREFTGEPDAAQCLIGAEAPEKRIWRAGPEMTVSTPHTFWTDWRNGKIGRIDQFGLIILDECHKARGKYPYVAIAKVAHDFGIPVLGLTAWEGDTDDEAADLCERCFFDRIVTLEVAMPPKYEDRILVPPTPALLEFERLLRALLARAVTDLVSMSIKVSDLCPGIKELGSLAKTSLPPWNFADPRTRKIWIAWARTVKLRHALSIGLLESYEIFLRFAEGLETALVSRMGRALHESANGQIFAAQGWQDAVELARGEGDGHPKVAEFRRLVPALAEHGKNGLVFVGYRDSAEYLAKLLAKEGLRTATLVGQTSARTQQAVLDRLAARELDFVTATSVVEEGVNIPAMDTVIHYSLPLLVIQRIQRSGRTGRTQAGEIISLILDHAFDKGLYWSVRQKETRRRNSRGRKLQSVPRQARSPLPLFDGPGS
jgi:ERCC4-related helicase